MLEVVQNQAQIINEETVTLPKKELFSYTEIQLVNFIGMDCY